MAGGRRRLQLWKHYLLPVSPSGSAIVAIDGGRKQRQPRMTQGARRSDVPGARSDIRLTGTVRLLKFLVKTTRQSAMTIPVRLNAH
jgi:hypothetical protein